MYTFISTNEKKKKVALRAKPPLCLSIGRNRWILETFETAKPGMELGQVDGRSGGRKGGRTFKES